MRYLWVGLKGLYSMLGIIILPFSIIVAILAFTVKKNDDIAIFAVLILTGYIIIWLFLMKLIPMLFKRKAYNLLSSYENNDFKPDLYFESIALDCFLWLDKSNKKFLYIPVNGKAIFDDINNLTSWEADIKRGGVSHIAFKTTYFENPIIEMAVSSSTINTKLAQLELIANEIQSI